MDTHEMHRRREQMRTTSKEQFESILKLAGLTIERSWELANGYWPLAPEYDEVRQPWWLFKTQVGLIQIGWRKRVIHIEWYHVKKIVTADTVTKDEGCVHAWSDIKAVEYLQELVRE